MVIDNRWQLVTCSGCKKSYVCTPEHDYYNATTASDGVCETCLCLSAGVHPDKTVTLTVADLVAGDGTRGPSTKADGGTVGEQ